MPPEDMVQVSRYQDSLTPNTYTAMFPYLTGLARQPAPELSTMNHLPYGGNLLVRDVKSMPA